MRDLRKWENLEFNCLVNIFGRVGVESLVLDVPFVCKSWYEATLDTSCWKRLRIPACVKYSRGHLPSAFKRFLDRFADEYHLEFLTHDRFMSFIISRGFSKSAFLDLSPPYECKHSDKYLQQAVEKCPELKSFSFGYYSNENVSNYIGKWKQLEEVTIHAITKSRMVDEILAEIALNCKNFNSLIFTNGIFLRKYALSIAKHLPKIKNLRIKLCYVDQKELEIILQSCKELEYLDVSTSRYVLKWDEEKLKQLSSHIKTSNLAVSRAYGTCWNSDFEESDCDSYIYNVDSSNSKEDRLFSRRKFGL